MYKYNKHYWHSTSILQGQYMFAWIAVYFFKNNAAVYLDIPYSYKIPFLDKNTNANVWSEESLRIKTESLADNQTILKITYISIMISSMMEPIKTWRSGVQKR